MQFDKEYILLYLCLVQIIPLSFFSLSPFSDISPPHFPPFPLTLYFRHLVCWSVSCWYSYRVFFCFPSTKYYICICHLLSSNSPCQALFPFAESSISYSHFVHPSLSLSHKKKKKNREKQAEKINNHFSTWFGKDMLALGAWRTLRRQKDIRQREILVISKH